MASSTQSIWTPANIVTCVRVALMPLWLLIAELSRPAGVGVSDLFAWGSFALFLLISLTDKLDGHLARSRGEITTFGKFLDPIADKLAVTCALLFLLELNLVSSWVVLLVLAREFLVSGMRMVVASEGTVVAASDLGKWKTATTMVAICCLLFYVACPAGILSTLTYWVGTISMYVAVALTAWSGADYFMQAWPSIANNG